MNNSEEDLGTQEMNPFKTTHLTYTGLHGGLEHCDLKIETRLIRFTSVMGECVI